MHHDSAWKEVLEKLFEQFLEFFFPAIHLDIDFTKGFEFLDWIIALPKDLDTEIFHEIKTIEEKKTMSVLTTAERIGMERGMERGIEKGLQKAISTVISTKFGESAIPLIQRIQKLENLLAKLTGVHNVSDAAKVFDEIESARIVNDKKKKGN